MPVGPPQRERISSRRVADLRADRAFQGQVDAGEQPPDPVGQPCGLAGQVVVEPDQHVQLGRRLVADTDRAQSVRQGPGCVGEDERVPGVNLRPARVEVGDACDAPIAAG